MAEIGNVTVRVDAVITDEQYHEAMSAVSAANEYIAALEAENGRLRMKTVSLEAALEGMHLICEQDKAENDNLRELVRELYEMAQPEAPSMFEAEFADRMRELGVEVDG